MQPVDEIEVRSEGEGNLPVLIYLPGVHGDRTLTRSIAKCLRNRVRFVIMTYPRTLDWSLDDYAAAVEAVLTKWNIRQGWLLAESFSSQVVWAIIGRARLAVQGIILAGGFVKHPLRWMVRPVGFFCRWSVVRLLLPCYPFYVKWCRRQALDDPELRADIHAFITRRTKRDLQAMRHRLHLIAGNDPRPIVRQSEVPVYALSGWLDPVVPWPLVRRWLRQNCPALRDYQVIVHSDHNVLQMAAQPSATLILEWMKA